MFALICKYTTLAFMSLSVSLQKVEARVASDQELKLTELLRYYMRDIQAAKVSHVVLMLSYHMYKFPAHVACNNTVLQTLIATCSNNKPCNIPQTRAQYEISLFFVSKSESRFTDKEKGKYSALLRAARQQLF